MNKAKTLGELKRSGYVTVPVRQEIRNNLISKIQKNESRFPGIIGFDDSVLPDLERAILSRHHILLLGLRGQAKTAIARLLVHLLDEWIPVIDGSELNDDPLEPISRFGKDMVEESGDATPVRWIHSAERYVEKLATPDVSVADLIGDVDPIKAAALRLPYADERVIHYGLVPRAHRSIFVMNELPDLQARIQVSLFNILQEGDIQIRGFKVRLPLDIQFVFTANPEDYTNRGSIITPLKDRIEARFSLIILPLFEDAKRITTQEAKLGDGQERVVVPEILRNILEQIAFEARNSEYIDDKSGVSARLSISAMENLVSTAERRMLINLESTTMARLSDLWGVIPSITGKVELVYEGQQEGVSSVAIKLIGAAIKRIFLQFLPDPEKHLRKNEVDLFEDVKSWFSRGNYLEFYIDEKDKEYQAKLNRIPGISVLARRISKEQNESYIAQELILHGLAECNVLSRDQISSKLSFKDMLSDMLDELSEN